ncbi:hypothetical protein CDCA_CDCA02G0477 [Cyanidium caldarium]|uniref:YCII-related domain-containing protein n=1 Tax=Cyanidium caldarium TaxID=2771 RepID=A0AAV9IQA8_CYACA|nr:hypothetical protein CDCA_CDCA02G0477 [Cyanidium caldarium]
MFIASTVRRLRVCSKWSMSTAAVFAWDRPGALLVRRSNRAAHLQWVQQEAAAIVCGGPFWRDDGSTPSLPSSSSSSSSSPLGSFLIVQSDALEFLQQDPYVQANLFQKRNVHPWRPAVGSLDRMPSDTVGVQPERRGQYHLVLGLDRPDALPRRLKARAAHLAWLQASDSTCVIGGAIWRTPTEAPADAQPVPYGSLLLVCGHATEADVRVWLRQDPYAHANVFAAVEVFAFQPVIVRPVDQMR